MLPLAFILQGQGAHISGSDRSRDQGRLPEKFAWIAAQGMNLYPQDGSGVKAEIDMLVVSTAVEESIPDIKAARELGVEIITRAALLARLFNQAETRVAVAGTSGKSTTTGMIGYVLQQAGRRPTVMNGAVFRNFSTAENPYTTAISGAADLFVTEADESDGSIAFYNPTIAVLNNIALDHKSMDELIHLFQDFIAKADAAVLNLDNAYVAELATRHAETAMTYGLDYPNTRLNATDVKLNPTGLTCKIHDRATKEECALQLQVPGRHNLLNALAAIGTCLLLGLSLSETCTHLAGFSGVKRRLEVIGSRNGLTVIDDFAHNPDKIAASLSALKEFSGPLKIVFQIHGFNPIRLMRNEFADVFARYLTAGDRLYIPEVLYLGGTVDRSVTAKDLVQDLNERHVAASWFATREEILPQLLAEATDGDRIVVMGARDDTLSDFARAILNRR